ncbi:MAG: hypothetical protein BWY47_00231 [Bacteroidetes bacterium ADurb.Bin302]|nr:MAG: hypothetical protein BWY47_00231 [Bacteroidetes bacterium ADurb.Bin302]
MNSTTGGLIWFMDANSSKLSINHPAANSVPTVEPLVIVNLN